MLLAPFAAVSMAQALAAGPTLLAAARARQLPCFAVRLIEGPAVILGQHQLAASVLDLTACARESLPVFRRASAGTAAFIGRRALFCTLALPHVAALFPDAAARTLLNRNVRPFLKGFSAAGVLAHYFGREWLSFRKRPGALLGFEMSADGAVLVEVITGFDHSIALPPDLCSARERSLDRYTGHAPAALAERLPAGTAPEAVARCLADAVAARASTPVTTDPELLAAFAGHSFAGQSALDLLAADPLLPPGSNLAPPTHVPIGWLEVALVPAMAATTPSSASHPGAANPWLGGDLLAPRFLLDRLAAAALLPAPAPPPVSAPDAPSAPLAASLEDAPRRAAPSAPPDAPLEGASLPEIMAALRRALAL